ncbi:gliding motility-associated C-terminal domain-containing protein, partial [Pontibacter sp. XAAS-A31]|nr:gliding motility-associated C-terminal domain-containing protein [Pontibacter harenae]
MPHGLRMRYLLHIGLLCFLITLMGILNKVQASHIRAGDITARRDTTANPNPRRFFFTMVIYMNTASTADHPTVRVSMGNGDVVLVNRVTGQSRGPNIGNQTDMNVYNWEYTYGADGTYIISWNGEVRNAGILNMAAPSDQHSFYISTTININSFRGFNSTPVLTVAPIDLAAVGRRFVHNPGAYDADGDSLSFKLRVPQRMGVGGAEPVPGYTLPSNTFAGCRNADDTGPAFLTLDPNNGQLVWDS